MLKDAFELATSRGVLGMKVPGGRVLVAADMRRGYEQWSEQEFLERTGTAYEVASKRAGISNIGSHVYYSSDDLTARSPTQPPWAIYPLPPMMCANLITDMALYLLAISSEPMLDGLRSAGLGAEWLLPEGQKELEPGQVILRVYKGRRALEMRPSDMQRLLLELVEQSTWIQTVEELLTRDNIVGHPWPYFEDEWKVWA